MWTLWAVGGDGGGALRAHRLSTSHGIAWTKDLRDPQMVALLQRLAQKLLKSTNMQLEGLLSEYRAAVPTAKQAPSLERVAYLGHLSQLMKQHVKAGRDDSRGELSRSELIKHGVPLEKAPSAKEASQTRPDVTWRNKRMNAWPAYGAPAFLPPRSGRDIV